MKTLPKIRKFDLADLDEILEIEEQAFPKTAYSRETILGYADSFPDNFMVIETAAAVVGYIIFDRSGHIHSTAVTSLHRRKGFGKMLFMHASQCTQKRLWLEVRSKNTGAIAFYKSLGMERVGRIPRYYGGDDALIMVLGQGGQTHCVEN